ncbi:MAG: CocE/NonD family hydrolase, partial [Candidatus Thorarchaeota archaeon]
GQHNILHIEDLEISMRDGIVLLADRYIPKGIKNPPLLLCRSCYGRKGIFGLMFGRFFAERGYQVLVQSCRGTSGSGDILNPNIQEHADGLDTIEWMKKQNWYPSRFGTIGGSYLGYTQWALADRAGTDLVSITPHYTTSIFSDHWYMGNSFSLEGHLLWCNMMKNAEKGLSMFGRTSKSKLKRILNSLPLIDFDVKLVGKELKAWRNIVLNSEPPYAYWDSTDRRDKVSNVKAKVNFLTGWWDIFLPWNLEDYLIFKKNGHTPYLTIGPWPHGNLALLAEGVKESIAWHDAFLRNKDTGLRKNPVRLFIMGSNVWKEYSEWPPQKSVPQHWFIQPGGILSKNNPIKSDPDTYVYDPENPTPKIEGGFGMMGIPWGQTDVRKIEKRKDVLVYTSKPIKKDLEIIGPVTAELYVKSSLNNTDFLVRVCDVFPNGKTLNICEGLQRLRPNDISFGEDATIKVKIELWPTAYSFKKGHRIRLHVASGSHPRWVLNTGSGEPIATATKFVTSHQEIYHDPEHLSVIILPVMH